MIRAFLIATSLLLSACYPVQVSGPVAGASVEITTLNESQAAADATSWTSNEVDAAFGADAVAEYPELLQVA